MTKEKLLEEAYKLDEECQQRADDSNKIYEQNVKLKKDLEDKRVIQSAEVPL